MRGGVGRHHAGSLAFDLLNSIVDDAVEDEAS